MGMAPYDTMVTPISDHASMRRTNDHINPKYTPLILLLTIWQEIVFTAFCTAFDMAREILISPGHQVPMQPVEREHWHLALAIISLIGSILALVLFLPM